MTALEEIKKALDAAEQFIVNGVELGYIRLPDPQTPDSANNTLPMIRLAQTAIESLQRENEELRNLVDRLKQEAQMNAMEARGANHTIAEIYQIISGGKGEPGNWRGANPVREYVDAAKGEILRLETELALSKPVYSRRQIEARVKALEEALKPFADYMGDHFDKDNHGNPMPDDLGVGWIYLTHADFRRAHTALASTGGEHHAE